MSLQDLNPQEPIEVEQKKPKMNPIRGALQKLRSNSAGSLFRGQYPDSRRLEELLVGCE
jgi:hypothetical protein